MHCIYHQFLGDELDEFNKFVAKFRENSQLNADYRAIIRYVEQIIEHGALERYFRNEGKMRDSVVHFLHCGQNCGYMPCDCRIR